MDMENSGSKTVQNETTSGSYFITFAFHLLSRIVIH